MARCLPPTVRRCRERRAGKRDVSDAVYPLTFRGKDADTGIPRVHCREVAIEPSQRIQVAELAWAGALSADASKVAAIGSEDADLVREIVGYIDVTLGVRDE